MLARTEEAAKRAILQHDPSAKRGAAQQLLDLDREVARLTASKLKAQKQAAEKSKLAAELTKTCAQLKKRLRAVLHDQRNLVVQLGIAQQKAGIKAAGLRLAAADGDLEAHHEARQGVPLSSPKRSTVTVSSLQSQQ